MLLILVLFSGVVGEIPIATLAAVLIFAAVSSLRFGRIDTTMRAGLPSRVALVATFAATLLLPVPAAVGIGVVLSLLLQLNQEAVDLTVVRMATGGDGRLVEAPAPETLPSRAVTVLDVYGSLLFAGARTLQARLRTRLAPSGPSSCCASAAGPGWEPRHSLSSPTTPNGSARPAGTSSSAAWSLTSSTRWGGLAASILRTP